MQQHSYKSADISTAPSAGTVPLPEVTADVWALEMSQCVKLSFL